MRIKDSIELPLPGISDKFKPNKLSTVPSKNVFVEKVNAMLYEYFSDFNEIDFDMGDNFCYWHGTGLVNYTFVISDNSSRYYEEFLSTLMAKNEINIFLMSLLHEIGHSETYDSLDEEEIIDCTNAKIQIEHLLTQENPDLHYLYTEYFGLTDEFEATNWAVNYYMEHKEDLNNLWNKIFILLQQQFSFKKHKINWECSPAALWQWLNSIIN